MIKMSKTNKLTKKEVIALMLADNNIASNEIYVTYLENELAILERKSSKSTITKTQVENESIKKAIVEVLTELAKPVTITELQASDSNMATYSNQKLSALLNQLVKTKVVTKVTDKKKSYFSIEG